MSVIQKLKGAVLPTESGPYPYECTECGRTFEVDAPPERVTCSECGNSDVTRRDR